MRVRLFLRAFSMSVLNSTGIYLVAHGTLLAGVTGCLISMNWISATRDGNDHRVPYSRICYGLGGGCGTVVAILFSRMLYRMHLL